jgi:hypothetical protein
MKSEAEIRRHRDDLLAAIDDDGTINAQTAFMQTHASLLSWVLGEDDGAIQSIVDDLRADVAALQRIN